ncbi:MAG: GNAT family N-acetyltransferase [Clostridiales bacterium]|nr:GNAT family N-acetyltransferase [Clostridiales bacterium]
MIRPFKPFPVLKTERLILKKLNHTHIQPIYEYQSNKSNFVHVDMPIYTSISDASNYVTKMNEGIDSYKWIIWAICLKESETLIGTISIWNLDEEENIAELGYGIFPQFRGKGYMQETLKLIEQYALFTMKLDCLQAYTSKTNLDSIKLLEHLEFDYLKTVVDTDTTSRTPIEMVVYKKCPHQLKENVNITTR